MLLLRHREYGFDDGCLVRCSRPNQLARLLLKPSQRSLLQRLHVQNSYSDRSNQRVILSIITFHCIKDSPERHISAVRSIDGEVGGE